MPRGRDAVINLRADNTGVSKVISDFKKEIRSAANELIDAANRSAEANQQQVRQAEQANKVAKQTEERQEQVAELAKQIREASYLTGEFKLRSGNISNFYWDKYRFESNPVLLTAIAAEMAKLLPSSCDGLAGIELGGIPLATALSLQTGIPCFYVRKAAKPYGTCNLIEGGAKEGSTLVVIEDVITTAGQVCTAIEQIREAGYTVEHVVAVIDRQAGGGSKIEALGCSFTSVFTLTELETISG